MAFNRQDLQVAFSVPGTCEFTVWGYGTTDSLEEILQPDYLESAGRLVALGDLIYVHTWPRRDPWDGRQVGERRAALVMVSGIDRNDASVRLVQDFGPPDEGNVDAASPEPIRGSRGRLPGRRVTR